MSELHPQPITIRGEAAHTFDRLPAVGKPAPDFQLADPDFKDWTLQDFVGRKKVLNIVPSLETPACRKSARSLSQALASRGDAVVLTISADLPFAQVRFREMLPMPTGMVLSTFRSPEFGMAYGTLIVEHAWMGLQARAIVVLDEDSIVQYARLGREITDQPDYATALAALEA